MIKAPAQVNAPLERLREIGKLKGTGKRRPRPQRSAFLSVTEVIMSVKRFARQIDILNSPVIITQTLRDDGKFPNNRRLPLLIDRQALNLPRHDPASAIEELLEENDWCNSWRDGIYTYHHYHSNTHEVLVVFSGSAEVQF